MILCAIALHVKAACLISGGIYCLDQVHCYRPSGDSRNRIVASRCRPLLRRATTQPCRRLEPDGGSPPPSRLFGANGLRTGPDGRVYIAQVTGSQISALDVATGRLDTVSAKGGDIIAPDDVAFDAEGNLYATEVMDGRVSMRDAAGRTRVLRDDVPSANGITFHRGRLFIGECRAGGRLLELDPQRRRATGAAGERRRRPTPWKSGPTACCTSR